MTSFFSLCSTICICRECRVVHACITCQLVMPITRYVLISDGIHTSAQGVFVFLFHCWGKALQLTEKGRSHTHVYTYTHTHAHTQCTLTYSHKLANTRMHTHARALTIALSQKLLNLYLIYVIIYISSR